MEFYLAAIEAFVKGQVNFEQDDMYLMLVDSKYVPLLKEHKTTSEVHGEVTSDGYDRQEVEGRKVEVKSGNVVCSAKDVKFTFKDKCEVGGAILVHDKTKTLVGYRKLEVEGKPIQANPGTLIVSFEDGLAKFQ